MVDTCIWVDFFKNTNHDQCDMLEHLIMEDRVLVSDVVRAELLVGSKSIKEFKLIESVINGLKIAPVNSEVFNEAANLGYELRRQGQTLPLTDLIIAAQCQQQNIPVWTKDKHFLVLHDKFNLEIKN